MYTEVWTEPASSSTRYLSGGAGRRHQAVTAPTLVRRHTRPHSRETRCQGHHLLTRPWGVDRLLLIVIPGDRQGKVQLIPGDRRGRRWLVVR